MAIERLKRQHVFESLTPGQINTLSEDSQVIRLKKGEFVYEKGQKADHFYVVLKGEVAIRLPGEGSKSILIDELAEGTMFGSCVSLALDSYFCTAQCAQESELLKTPSGVLKKILDDDCCAGYAIQSRISQIYFKRYMKTMEKLQTREREDTEEIMTEQNKPRNPDYVAHTAARPLQFFKDKDGNGWLCDKDIDPNKDPKEQGCWRCEEMPFPDGGR